MTLMDVESIQLHVDRSGRGAPLLLVHGFPLDHRMWRGQMEDLSQSFDVIALDLPGFGKSATGDAEEMTMSRFADVLAALLTELGIERPVTLCGLSMGGYIAWQFWRRHRDRLERLILCDTRAAADTAEVAAGRRETARQVLADGTDALADAMLPKLFAARSFRQRKSVVAQTKQVMRSACRQGVAAALLGMAVRPDMTDQLPEIDLPALLICGSDDQITPPREMEPLSDRMPQAELAVIPGCGHMAPLEDAVHVNKVIRQFLGVPHN